MAQDLIITMKSHSKEVDALVDAGIKKALSLMGEVVEDHAKELCPVDTGNLRNSITHTGGEDNTEYVGTNVEYAAPVEFMDRSHRVGQAHYLRDGAQGSIREMQAVAEAVFKSI